MPARFAADALLWAFRPPCMVTLCDGTAPRGALVRAWLLAARPLPPGPQWLHAAVPSRSLNPGLRRVAAECREKSTVRAAGHERLSFGQEV